MEEINLFVVITYYDEIYLQVIDTEGFKITKITADILGLERRYLVVRSLSVITVLGPGMFLQWKFLNCVRSHVYLYCLRSFRVNSSSRPDRQF